MSSRKIWRNFFGQSCRTRCNALKESRKSGNALNLRQMFAPSLFININATLPYNLNPTTTPEDGVIILRSSGILLHLSLPTINRSLTSDWNHFTMWKRNWKLWLLCNYREAKEKGDIKTQNQKVKDSMRTSCYNFPFQPKKQEQRSGGKVWRSSGGRRWGVSIRAT